MTTQTQSRTSAPVRATDTSANDTPPTARERVINAVVRREQRARDFGVGYGDSSGYASTRRYADNWGNARFQCG